jgi:hypothetical protein
MPVRLARHRLENMLRMAAVVGGRFPAVREEPVRGPHVVIEPDTGLVTVEVEIFVERPVDDVAEVIDPPHWDDGGRFFQGDGAFLVSREQAQCLADGRIDCGELRAVAPPSNDYDWAVLYERFHAADADGFESRFTNLLWVNPDWIRTPQGDRMYVVAYTLFAALEGRVGGVDGVKVIRDDGELSAKSLGPDRSRVRMRKQIRFESQWANIATYAAFRAAGVALQDQFRETASATVRP